MQKNKYISIIISTFNRVESLLKLLEELDQQFLGISDIECFEILVIDNNSTDTSLKDTKKFIAQKKSNVEIKYFVESTQGSSSARNRGIKEAQGQLLVFLDDDIQLSSEWLHEIDKFTKLDLKMFVAGARVQAQWARALPAWLRIKPPFEIISSCFPCHDFGLKTKVYPFRLGLRVIQNPMSACFLATKDIFEKYGNFREDLGISGERRGTCEDTEFFWRVLAGGEKISYLPQITVIHPIPESRMTPEFVLSWYELLGQTLQYMMNNKLNHLRPGSLNSQAPISINLLIKKLILKTLWKMSLITKQPAISFWLKCQIAKTQGQLNLNRKQ
jgi:glucosyl-dolichyl phosphate glucuronosyltransferase